MGWYGKIFSSYSGQQPDFSDMIHKFNLSFGESLSIKYLHSGDVFGHDATTPDDSNADGDVSDPEKVDRDILHWPCTLRAHTRNYCLFYSSDAADDLPSVDLALLLFSITSPSPHDTL